MNNLRTFFFLLTLLPGACAVAAGASTDLPPITAGDRVLVLAPHPDDEIIGAGGVIHQAVIAGADVRVVLMTNGENNRLSFMVYKKRPILTSKAYLEMGELRRLETLKALRVYGLHEKHLLSLGYPDFGTLKILTRHWDEPYSSLAARIKSVPEKNGYFSPGAPYTGHSILNDVTRILRQYKPTKIFISHPADENRDHRALYLFLRVALWDLEGQIERPGVYPYLVHFGGWPAPKGFRPELKQNVPLELRESDIEWRVLDFDEAALEAKSFALRSYASQIPYAPKFLVSHIRQDEWFGDYPNLFIPAPQERAVTWYPLVNYNPVIRVKKTGQEKLIHSFTAARQNDRVLIKFRIKKWINKPLGVTLTLLGYKKGVPFAEMPKIELSTRGKKVKAKDEKKKIPADGVELEVLAKEYRFSVPLSFLRDPDYILMSAKTRRWLDMAVDETAWRVLRLREHEPVSAPKADAPAAA